MGRPYTLEQIVERIKVIHGDLIMLDVTSYVNTRTRCRFIDIDYGDWWTDPWSVLSGRGHPKRGMASMGQKQTVTRAEAERRVAAIHNDTITIGDDFVGLSKRCAFIDKDFGVWRQLPQRIIDGTVHPRRRAEKARATCMLRHGVSHTNHLPEVMTKIAAKRPRWVKRLHWKTDVELTCMSSYEVAFIEWCAKERINFEWQVKHVMPDGRAYFIDARILDGQRANTWIELKGWMRPEGQRKWKWFHANNPNSELWTIDVLRSLHIL